MPGKSERSLISLKREAGKAARARGHVIKWEDGIGWGSNEYPYSIGVCRRCKLCVSVNAYIIPSGIQIGGGALALECHPQ